MARGGNGLRSGPLFRKCYESTALSGSRPRANDSYVNVTKDTSRATEHENPAEDANVRSSGVKAFREADLDLADHCRLNILWFHRALQGARALEISVASLPLSAALAATFGQVENLPSSALDFAAERPGIPFEDAAFDLVTLYGRGPSFEALQEIRRVLRPGGCLLLAAENRWWAEQLVGSSWYRSQAVSRRQLERAVAQAGFRERCSYWVEPSLATPRNVIPVRSDRVRSVEAMRRRDTGQSRARSFAVASGLHGLLYPAVLIVAKA